MTKICRAVVGQGIIRINSYKIIIHLLYKFHTFLSMLNFWLYLIFIAISSFIRFSTITIYSWDYYECNLSLNKWYSKGASTLLLIILLPVVFKMFCVSFIIAIGFSTWELWRFEFQISIYPYLSNLINWPKFVEQWRIQGLYG